MCEAYIKTLQYFKSSHDTGKIVRSESVVNLEEEVGFSGFNNVLSNEIEKFNKKKLKKQVINFQKINY
jgi:hypothetical protein